MTERIIYILRHGKAEVLAHHDDYRRRLTSVGRKDARLLAKHLVVAEVSVDRMVCSAAPRARQTADLVASWLGVPRKQLHRDRDLYEADSKKMAGCFARLAG